MIDPRGSAWFELAPVRLLDHPELGRIAELLASQQTWEHLHEAQQAGRYPIEIIEACRERGLMTLFGPEATAWHASGLNALSAAVDGSLAITLGVNLLALLPIHLDAEEPLRSTVFAGVAQGRFSAMLLSEWTPGSDLARTGTIATLEPEGYRVVGHKELINGATHHPLITVLARTHVDAPDLAAHSVLWIDRDAAPRGISTTSRWSTLPTHGADIGGIRLHGAVVPKTHVVGPPGDGLAVIRRTLTMSRGGVSALSAGAARAAVALSEAYARERRIADQPIASFEPIAEHLMRGRELESLCAALSLRAVAASNALGLAAATETAAAKLLCADLAEQAVTEGRRVLGARALLEALPYARLVRDVQLYGVFDGTQHVMLRELAFRLDRLQTFATPRDEPLKAERVMWHADPTPLSSLRSKPALVRRDLLALAQHCSRVSSMPATQALPKLLEGLLDLPSDASTSQRGRSFALWLALLAATELGDDEVARQLGLSTPDHRRAALQSGATRLALDLAHELVRLRRPVQPDLLATLADDLDARRAQLLDELTSCAAEPPHVWTRVLEPSFVDR